jgi:hypothetical protein
MPATSGQRPSDAVLRVASHRAVVEGDTLADVGEGPQIALRSRRMGGHCSTAEPPDRPRSGCPGACETTGQNARMARTLMIALFLSLWAWMPVPKSWHHAAPAHASEELQYKARKKPPIAALLR